MELGFVVIDMRAAWYLGFSGGEEEAEFLPEGGRVDKAEARGTSSCSAGTAGTAGPGV